MSTSKTVFPKFELHVGRYMYWSARHALRALIFFDQNKSASDHPDASLQRLLRAFLTITSILAFPNDKNLHAQLRSADIAIDAHDLTFEVEDRVDVAMVLPDTPTTFAQHLPTWWIAQFDGSPQWENGTQFAKLILNIPIQNTDTLTKSAFQKVLHDELELDRDLLDIEAFDCELYRLHEVSTEKELESTISNFLERIQNTTRFWRDWYQGFLDGNPLPWELQRRVALIPDEDWEQGPEHIAKLIEDIRREFESEQTATEPRAPEHEPDNVEQLFKHPLSVSASLHLSSQAVLQGLEAFRRASGLNETPEFLQPLEAMPTYLERIRGILLNSQRSPESEQALKFEIGRLNAKVAQLEIELAKLRVDLEQQKKPWFGKAAVVGTSIAAVVSFVWNLSGDDMSLEDRAEKIIEDWEYLFPAEPPQQNTTEQPTLPPTTDT